MVLKVLLLLCLITLCVGLPQYDYYNDYNDYHDYNDDNNYNDDNCGGNGCGTVPFIIEGKYDPLTHNQ